MARRCRQISVLSSPLSPPSPAPPLPTASSSCTKSPALSPTEVPPLCRGDTAFTGDGDAKMSLVAVLTGGSSSDAAGATATTPALESPSQAMLPALCFILKLRVLFCDDLHCADAPSLFLLLSYRCCDSFKVRSTFDAATLVGAGVGETEEAGDRRRGCVLPGDEGVTGALLTFLIRAVSWYSGAA